MKMLYQGICKFFNRFFPTWAYLFALPIPGLAPTTEQLKVLNQHGIRQLKLEFRPNMGTVVPRIYWTDWETDFWPPEALSGLPREALLVTRLGPQNFEVRGGASYADLTQDAFESMLAHLLPPATDGVSHVRRHLVPRGAAAGSSKGTA